MTDAPTGTKLTGRCVCGQVTVTVAPQRPGIDVCHCSMCRQWSGGPFFSLHGVERDAFQVDRAEKVTTFASSRWAERAFCATCGSNLWFHFLPAGTFSFMAGLFDLPPGYAIDEQIFVDERPDWARLAAKSVEKTGAQVQQEAEAAGFSFG